MWKANSKHSEGRSDALSFKWPTAALINKKVEEMLGKSWNRKKLFAKNAIRIFRTKIPQLPKTHHPTTPKLNHHQWTQIEKQKKRKGANKLGAAFLTSSNNCSVQYLPTKTFGGRSHNIPPACTTFRLQCSPPEFACTRRFSSAPSTLPQKVAPQHTLFQLKSKRMHTLTFVVCVQHGSKSSMCRAIYSQAWTRAGHIIRCLLFRWKTQTKQMKHRRERVMQTKW